jgi:hypothetical protein
MHPSGSRIPGPLPENRQFPASLNDRTGRMVMNQPFDKLMAGADEMPDSLPALVSGALALLVYQPPSSGFYGTRGEASN